LEGQRPADIYANQYKTDLYQLAYIFDLYAKVYIASLYIIAYNEVWRIIMNQLARTPKQIGEILRRHRHLTGISQGELGSRVGLRQATISQIESGHRATKISTICDLLAALDLELTVAARSKGSSQDIEDTF
jgi:HTH-type transcriptional regulator / antitoxin HipB